MRKIKLLLFFLIFVQLGFSSDWIPKTKIPMSKDDYNALDVKIISKDLIYVTHRDTIWYTNDIGDTWQYLAIPDSVEYILDFFALNSKKLWISTSEGFYNSENSGNTWDLLNSSRFTTIHFTNDSIGFGCKYNTSTSNHSIYKTEDKGQTWRVVFNSYGISSLDDIQFLGDKIGYAIGETFGSYEIGHIYKTQNYGNSWQKVTFPSSANNNKGYYSRFQTLFIRDYYNVFAGGNQLIRSNNSGEDWTEIFDNSLALPRSITVNDIYSFSDTLCYFSNYSSSPQRLYKVTNDDFDSREYEISTMEGYLDFDFNNNIGIAFAVSSNGNCWADTTVEQNHEVYNGLVANKNEIEFELSICESLDQAFSLSNNGNNIIIIDSISHSSEYKISHENEYALYPEEFINLEVTFSPSRTGIYQDTLKIYANSAKSPFTILLQNNVDSIAFNEQESLSIFSGDSLLWHGLFYKEQGEYIVNYKTILGCDSIYNLSLSVNTVNIDIKTNDLQIYPNPLKEYLFIDDAFQSIEIYDLKGILIKSIAINNSICIYLGDLENGIYFARLYTSKSSLNKKLIIEK